MYAHEGIVKIGNITWPGNWWFGIDYIILNVNNRGIYNIVRQKGNATISTERHIILQEKQFRKSAPVRTKGNTQRNNGGRCSNTDTCKSENQAQKFLYSPWNKLGTTPRESMYQYVHLRSNKEKKDWLMSAFFEMGKRSDIQNDTMSKVLKLESKKLSQSVNKRNRDKGHKQPLSLRA